MTRIKPLFIFLILFVPGCKNHQDVTRAKAMENLIEEIKEDNYMGTPYIARSTSLDPAYLRKQRLKELATETKLLELAYHTHPIVSLTAFQGLFERNHPSISEVFHNYYLSNKEFITFVKGDMVLEISVLEYAYTQILNSEGSEDENSNETGASKLKLSPAEQLHIQELIDSLNSQK